MKKMLFILIILLTGLLLFGCTTTTSSIGPQGETGLQGPKGDTGAIGPSGISGYERIVVRELVTFNRNTRGMLNASCPVGKVILSGSCMPGDVQSNPTSYNYSSYSITGFPSSNAYYDTDKKSFTIYDPTNQAYQTWNCRIQRYAYDDLPPTQNISLEIEATAICANIEK